MNNPERPADSEPTRSEGTPLFSAETTAPDPPFIPSPSGTPLLTVPGYKLIREISRGGQGVVYLAIQQSTGRKVAIKVTWKGAFAGPHDRARFDREVQILAALQHPNIVAIIDRGDTETGAAYFVMQYIEGQPLDAYVEEYRRQKDHHTDPAELLRLFMKICDAVNAAHLRGIVHRDLKPSNIRIDPTGEPFILDFGLARTATDNLSGEHEPVTVTGQFLGSLPWASPEQAEGLPAKIDTRTDVYSLGVILYQLLTGQFPYEVVGNMRDVLDNIMRAQPTPPSAVIEARLAKQAQGQQRRRRHHRNPINGIIEAIVLKALAKRREARYQTAGELSRDIANYLSGKPTIAGGVMLQSIAVRQHLVIAAAALLLIVTGGLVWMNWPRPAEDATSKGQIIHTVAKNPISSIDKQIEACKATLLDKSDDTDALSELVRIYALEQNNIAEAIQYASSSIDPKLKEWAKIANEGPYQAEVKHALVLADWYRKAAERCSPAVQTAAREKSLLYYEHFMGLHSAEDTDRLKASLAVEQLEKQLGWVDLLTLVDPAKDERGDSRWEKNAMGLICVSHQNPANFPKIRVPGIISGNYEMVLRMVRNDGWCVIVNDLPIDNSYISFILNWWERNGFEPIRKHKIGEPNGNESMVYRDDPVVGTEYVLALRVEQDHERVHLTATLDGKPFVDWKGTYADITVQHPSSLVFAPKSLSLTVAHEENKPGYGYVFPSFRVRMLNGSFQATRTIQSVPLVNGAIILSAAEAEIVGHSLELGKDSGDLPNLGSWTNIEAFPRWKVQVEKPGYYVPILTYAHNHQDGTEITLIADDQQVNGKLPSTGNWVDYAALRLPILKIDKTGPLMVTLKTKYKPVDWVMNIQSIVLQPVDKTPDADKTIAPAK